MLRPGDLLVWVGIRRGGTALVDTGLFGTERKSEYDDRGGLYNCKRLYLELTGRQFCAGQPCARGMMS